ncbi:MAG: hypothetical protein ACD_46C00218G0003 [uncultured bacterium]|nr:MAG: hypothetical protein ACD_46C00218G0003 [uncultured bacterium]
MKVVVLSGSSRDKNAFTLRMRKECNQRNITLDTNVDTELLSKLGTTESNIYFYFKLHDEEIVVGLDAINDEENYTICSQPYPKEMVSLMAIGQDNHLTSDFHYDNFTKSPLDFMAEKLKLIKPSPYIFNSLFNTAYEAAASAVNNITTKLGIK